MTDSVSERPQRLRVNGKRLPAPPVGAAVELAGFAGVRLTAGQADAALREAADRLTPPRPLLTRNDLNILALSGGAAGGAFGAGALVGLSRSGRRPDFAIVTGVSTGALIAPLAFLGPDWDDQLIEAYTGGRASTLLSLRRFAAGLGAGVFRGESLEELVSPFVNQALVDAVAREHAKGRRLLVATTNLDAQRTCVWDMGAIASHGDEAAVRLFRDVLIASATLPGLFPPKLFEVESDGVPYHEMHVDGGASAPLFVMPEALLRWRDLGARVRGGQVYIIVNTVLEPSPRATPSGLPSVLARSFDTMLRLSYRQALDVARGFCARHNLPLAVASIPHSLDGVNMLSFETANMRMIFDAGESLARAGDLWPDGKMRQPPARRRLFAPLQRG